MRFRHFVPLSGGKDSLATLLVARERAERKPGFVPIVQTADTMNESPLWREYVDYLERALDISVQMVSAYDVPGLIDETAFARRREAIPRDWSKELRVRRHTTECKARRENLPPASVRCRPSTDRIEAVRQFARLCEEGCPVIVTPPSSDERIAEAVAAMQPTGNAFLDLCLIHGRFPSKQAKFCTEELKLLPLFRARDVMMQPGDVSVDWVGERAEESKRRAAKPIFERTVTGEGRAGVIYRPIHSLTHQEVFAIAKRHGIKPNPLYLIGASRVGCWPCINARKAEIALVARHSPDEIDKLREWERLVSLVSRRYDHDNGRGATFFHSGTLPAGRADEPEDRANIDAVVEWARTGRGGRNLDLLTLLDDLEADDGIERCSSLYGLCE